MSKAKRLAKPTLNYGSEFEQTSGGSKGWDTPLGATARDTLGDRTTKIPEDAPTTNDLNNELFNSGGSELSFGMALNRRSSSPQDLQEDPQSNDIESVGRERSPVAQTTPPTDILKIARVEVNTATAYFHHSLHLPLDFSCRTPLALRPRRNNHITEAPRTYHRMG